jgi:hypothetical protein
MARPTDYTPELVAKIHRTKGRSGVYALKECGSDVVRYVGRSKNIGARFAGHKSSKSNLPSAKWVKSLMKQGRRVDVVVLEYHERPEEIEARWIEKYRADGQADLNLHDGGKGFPMNGGGKCQGVWSVESVASPFNIMFKCLWKYQKTKAAREISAHWKKAWADAKTEKEKILVQVKCFHVVQNLGTSELIDQAEKWAISASKSINGKYPKMVSLVYADGVEVTP